MVVNENDVVIRLRLEAEQLKREMAAVNKRLKASFSTLESNNLAELQQKAYKNTEKLNKSLGKTPFAGYAMSIMFAGMALQRYSMQLYKFGTKAFQEISHSIEGTVTNTDILEGSMKYLGFTVGEALEPMIAYLIPIVDKISEWTSKNPELVATMTTLGIVLGTVAMFLGMGKLALTGLLDGFTKLTPAITAGKGAITGLAAALGTTVIVAIGIVLLAIASLAAMWKTNFAGMRDFVKQTFGVIWETIKGVLGHVWAIVKNVWGLVMAILSGDWDEAWKRIKNILINALALLLKVIAGFGAAVLNIFKFAWNFSLSAFELFIDGVLWGLQQVAKAMDKVFGTNLSGNIESVRNSISSFFNKIKLDYTTREQVTGAFGGIDKMLGLDVGASKRSEGAITNNINNTYIGDIKVEDPMAIEALNNFTRIAGGS